MVPEDPRLLYHTLRRCDLGRENLLQACGLAERDYRLFLGQATLETLVRVMGLI